MFADLFCGSDIKEVCADIIFLICGFDTKNLNEVQSNIQTPVQFNSVQFNLANNSQLESVVLEKVVIDLCEITH